MPRRRALKPRITFNCLRYTTGQQLPYISRQDELFKNDNEVRILTLINGEVDYKSQSVQLPSAPILLQNQEKSGYTVQLKPTIAMPVFGFNLTHPDEATREVFGNVDFRRAMSVAIDRNTLNEVVYFGQGEARAYFGFSPTPAFVDPALTKLHTEFDPEAAKAALEALGMVDDINAFQQAVPGSDATGEIGARLAKTTAENLVFIGTVQAPNPIVVRNGLKNVPEFQTWSYEYYRTYPYRGTQWFLAADN